MKAFIKFVSVYCQIYVYYGFYSFTFPAKMKLLTFNPGNGNEWEGGE